jgi:hypothetical protein
MRDAEDYSSSYARIPARVLGCLRGGEITISLFPGHGIVVTQAIQTHLVPETLRMPNSEFDVVVRNPDAEIIRVLRCGESCSEMDRCNE